MKSCCRSKMAPPLCIGQKSTKFGQKSTKFGQNQPNLAKINQIWPKSPKFGQNQPNLAKSDDICGQSYKTLYDRSLRL